MEPKWTGYSVSWTQPYSVSMNPFYSQPSVVNELAVIDAIDRLVESGLTHPVADAILKSLVNNSKE